MINKVFYYSKDIAKKNGNRLPILELVLITVMFLIMIVLYVLFFDSFLLFMLIMLISFGLIIYYSVILSLKMRTKMTGWVTTNEGRIFKAMIINNGQGLYLTGLATVHLIDKISDSNYGSSIGGALGAGAQFYAMNKSAQYMSNPEVVAKIVEEAQNVRGAVVFEILKIYSMNETRKSIKINCDYRIVKTGKIKYHKNMTIEKSYNEFNDLVFSLNNHRI